MKNILDDLGRIRRLDKSDMLGLLGDFPRQLKNALDIARDTDVKIKGTISNIVFTGVGGSAIGGDVARAVILDELKAPFIVNRDYFVPGFVNEKTLMIASSYSGNTEETISAYKHGRKKKAKIIVITSGGELEALARKDGYPAIKIPGGMPPRCALGYSFVPVLVAISKIGLIENKEKDMYEAMEVIYRLRDKSIGQGVPSEKNEAKDLASLIFGRFCAIYG
ncbi:MAG: SIS domain-containing protein, partial [Candidatus Omnitrophica bacterium]|nr:SIS domain-containing protein [Candidatus Omnitrophota bacterium]